MRTRINQEQEHHNFTISIKRELELASENAPAEQLLELKTQVEGFFLKRNKPACESSPQEGWLSHEIWSTIPDNIQNALAPYHQRENEEHGHYLERTKTVRKEAIGICLANLRNRQKDIDEFINSSDRIKKIILILIGYNYPNCTLQPVDLENSASINRLLRELLVKWHPKKLKYYESFQPYYSAFFEDHNFLYYIEKTKKLHALPYSHLCLYKSITPLDSFRIEAELTHQASLQQRNQTRHPHYQRQQQQYNSWQQEPNQAFEKIVAEFASFEKELKKINRSLAKLKNPLYAELKEYIINEGLSINKNTGVDILLNPEERTEQFNTIKTRAERIKTIEKRIKQREFRKKDAYTQINFKLYTLPGHIDRSEFEHNKSALINNLINKFLAIETKHINAAITSNKNLSYIKSKTRLTIRVSKKAHRKIKKLATQHKITQELLINIIIQDSKDDHTRFTEKLSD